jgi:ubiquinol-cytochrome c reductase iron-sulfur subunit
VSFACVSTALIVIAKRLVVSEELEEEYPEPEHPEEQERIAQLVEESGDRITRKRLMIVAGGAAGTALGAAALAPALSLGPVLDTSGLRDTPWRRGRRLVDSDGRPLRAADISTDTFYSAFPEGAKEDKVGSPVVVVRLDPKRLRLPPGREGWAPEGIIAFSKICTHAGCAVSEYRTPLFEPTAPSPALVCPCHYSTFDPATGGEVLFGPAGRPLPQLPLTIDSNGDLRAGGGYSGPVGPGWSGVRT